MINTFLCILERRYEMKFFFPPRILSPTEENISASGEQLLIL